jgi:excisionase family DNA binding protein
MVGVSKRTMQKLVAEGTIVPVRIPGLARPRFRRSDVEALIREASP